MLQPPGSSQSGQIHISNDKQIMDDLDRIINNLENQQKNMATFRPGEEEN